MWTYEVYCGEHVHEESGNEDHPKGEATLTGRYRLDVTFVESIARLEGGHERRVDIIDHVSACEEGRR